MKTVFNLSVVLLLGVSPSVAQQPSGNDLPSAPSAVQQQQQEQREQQEQARRDQQQKEQAEKQKAAQQTILAPAPDPAPGSASTKEPEIHPTNRLLSSRNRLTK